MLRSLLDAVGRLFGGGPLPRRVRKEFPPGALDFDAQKIVRRLRRVGQGESYLVGGGVRDLLLGRTPKDFDVATSCSPWQVRKLFRNSRLIGRRFLLNHVFFRGGKIIEVSTFRKRPVLPEGEEAPVEPLKSDNEFGNAEEDARRRDFTVNGLFYDEEKNEVLDYVGGLKDLDRKLIRAIGEPAVRFKEDPIRMLRAVKFAAKLNFKIEATTAKAILENGSELRKASLPRLVEEILRLFSSGASERSLDILRQTGLLSIVLPEIPTPVPAALGARLRALDHLQALGEVPSHALIWSALLWDLAEKSMREGRGRNQKFVVGDVLNPLASRLKASRKDMDLTRLTFLSQTRFDEGEMRRRGAAEGFLPKPYFRDALLLHYLRTVSAGEALGGRNWGAYSSWRQKWLERNPQGILPEAGLPKGSPRPIPPPRPAAVEGGEPQERMNGSRERVSREGRERFQGHRDRGGRERNRGDSGRRDNFRRGRDAQRDRGPRPGPAPQAPPSSGETALQSTEAGASGEQASQGEQGMQEARSRRRFEGRRQGRGRDRGRRPEAREPNANKAPEAPPMAKQGIEDRKELEKEMSQVELKEDQDKEAKSFFDGNI